MNEYDLINFANRFLNRGKKQDPVKQQKKLKIQLVVMAFLLAAILFLHYVLPRFAF